MTMFLFLFIAVLGILLLLIVILMRYVLLVVTVENISMAPTLEPGDRVLVLRHWPGRWLRKGHIILVWPEYMSNKAPKLFKITPFIKRIAALGGEPFPEVASGLLEAEIVSQQQTGLHQDHLQLRRIPENHLFVRGDNPAYSFDSRVWGPVSLKRVLGVMLMKLPSKAPYGTSAHVREADI